MPGGRRMTDIRSLSGSLNVTAGSGIRDSEGGATKNRRFTSDFPQTGKNTNKYISNSSILTNGLILPTYF